MLARDHLPWDPGASRVSSGSSASPRLYTISHAANRLASSLPHRPYRPHTQRRTLLASWHRDPIHRRRSCLGPHRQQQRSHLFRRILLRVAGISGERVAPQWTPAADCGIVWVAACGRCCLIWQHLIPGCGGSAGCGSAARIDSGAARACRQEGVEHPPGSDAGCDTGAMGPV